MSVIKKLSITQLKLTLLHPPSQQQKTMLKGLFTHKASKLYESFAICHFGVFAKIT